MLRPTIPFYVVTAIMSLGQGLVLAYSVVYLHDARSFSLAVAGTTVATSGVIGLIASPIGGSLTDHFGTGRSMAMGLFAQGIGAVIFAGATSVPIAVLGLSFSGFGSAISWPAQSSLLSSLVAPPQRSRAYALQFTILNAGLGLGGIVSGFLVHLHSVASFQHIYDTFATIAVLSSVFVLAIFSRRKFPPHRDMKPNHQGGGYRDVLGNQAFRRYLLFNLILLFFGYGQLEAGWTAFATIYAHVTPRVVGLAFAVNTATIVLAQLFALRFINRMRRSRALATTALGWAISWAVVGLAAISGLPHLLVVVALCLSLGVFGLAETFYSPVANSLVNALATDAARGRYNALASSSWSIATLLGAPSAGALLSLGTPWPWVVTLVFGATISSTLALRLPKYLPRSSDAPPTAHVAENPT